MLGQGTARSGACRGGARRGSPPPHAAPRHRPAAPERDRALTHHPSGRRLAPASLDRLPRRARLADCHSVTRGTGDAPRRGPGHAGRRHHDRVAAMDDADALAGVRVAPHDNGHPAIHGSAARRCTERLAAHSRGGHPASITGVHRRAHVAVGHRVVTDAHRHPSLTGGPVGEHQAIRLGHRARDGSGGHRPRVRRPHGAPGVDVHRALTGQRRWPRQWR